MGTFYVDDLFPEHPKAQRAGEDACWLYICGLAWCHRHNTGVIPEGMLRRLTGKPDPEVLAGRLVAAGLWETCEAGGDEGVDGWHVHDWETFNAKSITRRRAGKKGAEARWQNGGLPDSKTPKVPDGVEGGLLMPKEPCIQVSKPTSSDGCADEDEKFANLPTAVRAGLGLLADRRPAGRVNPARYRRVVLANLARDHAERIAGLPDGLTAVQVADRLEPTSFLVAPVRVDCDDCGGSGWVYDEASGAASRCGHR